MSGEDANAPKTEWFTSSLMHIKGSNQKLYIVVGGGPMMGAHSTHYWLIRTEGVHAQVILRAFGDSLVMEHNIHHGMRDVTVSYPWAEGVTNIRYEFNSGTYIEKRNWTDKIDPGGI